MEKNKRPPGRPKGTTQNGESTPKQKLKILRSKAWAWTCSYYLSDNPGKYLGVGKTATAANNFVTTKEESAQSYDGAFFSRRRRGIEGVTRDTVLNLWADVKDAYLIGPLVDDGFAKFGGEYRGQRRSNRLAALFSQEDQKHKKDWGPLQFGAFVPLWASISTKSSDSKDKQKIELLKEWAKIPDYAWGDWAQFVERSYREDIEHINKEMVKCKAIHASDYIPAKNTFKSITTCYDFLSHVAACPYHARYFSILTLAAAFSCRCFDGSEELLLFDSRPIDFGRKKYSLHPETRPNLIAALDKIGITIAEIIDVAESNQPGYLFSDCSAEKWEDDSLETKAEQADYQTITKPLELANVLDAVLWLEKQREKGNVFLSRDKEPERYLLGRNLATQFIALGKDEDDAAVIAFRAHHDTAWATALNWSKAYLPSEPPALRLVHSPLKIEELDSSLPTFSIELLICAELQDFLARHKKAKICSFTEKGLIPAELEKSVEIVTSVMEPRDRISPQKSNP